MSYNHLHIVSFNCNGMKSSLADILYLCDNYDIIFLQETWLFPHNLCMLKKLNVEFHGDGISAIDTSSGIITGRPYGGLGVLWRKSLNIDINVIKYGNESRLMGVRVQTPSSEIFMLNVYLPTDTKENLDDFQSYLYKVHTIFGNNTTVDNLMIGDLNANTRKPSSFGSEMIRFCHENGYFICDTAMLPDDSFTYYSAAHDTVSWLDHVIGSTSIFKAMKHMHILYDMLSSDHFPIVLTIKLSCLTTTMLDEPYCNRELVKVNWSRVNDRLLLEYRAMTDALLSRVNIQLPALHCHGTGCFNREHRMSMIALYDSIIGCLNQANRVITHTDHCHRYTPVPGWTEYLEEPYRVAKDAFEEWRSLGKPRYGFVCQNMRKSRAAFKYAQRSVMKNEDMLRADSLANKLKSGDARTFWKEVKRLNCGTVPLTDKIDGISGNVSILDMWKEHYYTLFNSDTVPLRDEPDTKPSVSDNANADFVKTQVTELVQAIKQLPCNKSPGHDGLMSEHFQRASDRLPVLLSLI